MDHKKIPDILKNDYCRYFILLAFLGSNIDRVITQHALNFVENCSDGKVLHFCVSNYYQFFVTSIITVKHFFL